MPRRGERREITLADGTETAMFIDYTVPAPKPCYICGKPGIALCDYLVPGEKKTCDRSLCKIHAMKPIATFGKPETANIDYCPDHYRMIRQQQLEIKKDGFFDA